jgi:hypothetical protein
MMVDELVEPLRIWTAAAQRANERRQVRCVLLTLPSNGSVNW